MSYPNSRAKQTPNHPPATEVGVAMGEPSSNQVSLALCNLEMRFY